MFNEYLRVWALTPDGASIYTSGGRLLPVVTSDGISAMLKVGVRPGESQQGALLDWWKGRGAVPVLASRGPAVLMLRAEDPDRLLRMYTDGLDETAVNVIAGVASALHQPVSTQVPTVVTPLASWFADLPAAADRLGGVLHSCARVAAELLASPSDVTVLHGDLHHENVLYFGELGWLAVDPKGVVGERTFEYVPALLDPDDTNEPDTARLDRLIDMTATAGSLEESRLRSWLLAWAGLTATWWLEDGKSPEPSIRVAEAIAATVIV